MEFWHRQTGYLEVDSLDSSDSAEFNEDISWCIQPSQGEHEALHVHFRESQNYCLASKNFITATASELTDLRGLVKEKPELKMICDSSEWLNTCILY